MATGLIGRKKGMTSIFDENGKNIPCTIIELGPCVVTQIKSDATDGYSAVQVGYDEKKEKNTPAAMQGHFKKAKTSPKRKLVEFEMFSNEVKMGDTISAADVFAEGDFVDAIGTSKGKGFQGVVKRHNFAGVGQATHGQHNRLRAPGSIGAASYPAKVFKGMRMAGQTGDVRVKTQNLKIVKVLAEKNLVLVKGAIPGYNGNFVIVEK